MSSDEPSHHATSVKQDALPQVWACANQLRWNHCRGAKEADKSVSRPGRILSSLRSPRRELRMSPSALIRWILERLTAATPWPHSRSTLSSILVGANDFTSRPRDQADHDVRVDALLEEMHRAVREAHIDPAGVERIELVVAAAVDHADP